MGRKQVKNLSQTLPLLPLLHTLVMSHKIPSPLRSPFQDVFWRAYFTGLAQPCWKAKSILGVYTQGQIEFSPYHFVRIFSPNSWCILIPMQGSHWKTILDNFCHLAKSQSASRLQKWGYTHTYMYMYIYIYTHIWIYIYTTYLAIYLYLYIHTSCVPGIVLSDLYIYQFILSFQHFHEAGSISMLI